MKFFRKTSVAVLLTALVVVLCCVWGYTRAYTSVQQQEETQSQRAGMMFSYTVATPPPMTTWKRSPLCGTAPSTPCMCSRLF